MSETVVESIVVLGIFMLIFSPLWFFPLIDSIKNSIGWFSDRFSDFHLNRTRSSTTSKILILKLLSTDPKEIEKFIENNVAYLSHADILKLANRIEELRMDTSIASDDLLKKRIADLEPICYDPPISKSSRGKRA